MQLTQVALDAMEQRLDPAVDNGKLDEVRNIPRTRSVKDVLPMLPHRVRTYEKLVSDFRAALSGCDALNDRNFTTREQASWLL